MISYYLDYAAATPLDERVFRVMQPYLKEKFYNPSAAYQSAREVRSVFEEARHQLAIAIGAKPTEIIMTAGASESINLAIHGVMRSIGGMIITPSIEHPAVLASAAHYDHHVIDVDDRGLVDIDHLRAGIDDTTTLVSVGYANNELGTVQPIRGIAAMIADIRTDRLTRHITTPLYLHTDASQAAGLLDISITRLGIDMMTLNAGKCYGPKQTGLLWVRPGLVLAPLIDGGGQENGLRSGTENVAGCVGFAEALAIAQHDRKGETIRLAALRDRLQKDLCDGIPDLIVNGHPTLRLANHLHVSLPGLDGERAVFALDQRGVMVATGSACSASKGVRSHVLGAVGMATDHIDGSLRLSLGRQTNDQAIDAVIPILIEVLGQERGR